MNNRERELWVMNTEDWYLMYRRWTRTNKGGMRGFLREHRSEIDAFIAKVIGR